MDTLCNDFPLKVMVISSELILLPRAALRDGVVKFAGAYPYGSLDKTSHGEFGRVALRVTETQGGKMTLYLFRGVGAAPWLVKQGHWNDERKQQI